MSLACKVCLTSPRILVIFFFKTQDRGFSLRILLCFSLRVPWFLSLCFRHHVYFYCKDCWWEKSTRHLLKNMKSGGLRPAWGLQQDLLAFVLATHSPIRLLCPVGHIFPALQLKCGYHSQKHLQASIPDLAALATKWQATNATLTWCLAVSIPSRTVVLKSSCLPCGRKEENSGTLLHKLR